MSQKWITLIVVVVLVAAGYYVFRTYIMPPEIKNEAVLNALSTYVRDEMLPEDFGLEPRTKTWKLERTAIMKLEEDSITPDERTAEVTFWGNYEDATNNQIPVPRKFKISLRFLVEGKDTGVLKIKPLK